ncbi:hypothetical protein, partial [Nocardia brasiliensis]|uniref:hypothetical protein n=1 Tax=Nocardia brasiliensis TaxID=37326 RepID=UPI0024562A67
MIRIGGVDFALRPTRRPIIVAPTAATARAAKSAPTSAVPPSVLEAGRLVGGGGGGCGGVFRGMVTGMCGGLDLAGRPG